MKKMIWTNFIILISSVGIISCNTGSIDNQPKISISTESNTLTLGQVVRVTITANDSAAALSPSIILVSAKNDTIVVDPNSSCELESSSPTCVFLIGAEALTSGTKITAISLESTIPDAKAIITVVNNPTKYIFVSESSPSGNMYRDEPPFNDAVLYPTGVSRADAICQSNAVQSASHLDWIKNPENYTWKAMLVDGENRIAAPLNKQKNWVLSPKTTYKDAVTGIVYGQTNEKSVFEDISGLIVQFGDLRNENQSYWGNSGLAWSEFNHEIMFWTGMNGNSTTSEQNCSEWNSLSSTEFANFGIVDVHGTPFDPINRSDYFASIFQYSFFQWDYIGHAAFCDATENPNIAIRLICVQQ